MAPDQQIAGGLGVVEDVERQAVGFGIPPGVAFVVFSGQALGCNIEVRVHAVLDLAEVVDGEPDGLLVGRAALDDDIERFPLLAPVVAVGGQGRIVADLGVLARQGHPTLPEVGHLDLGALFRGVDRDLVDRDRGAGLEGQRQVVGDSSRVLDHLACRALGGFDVRGCEDAMARALGLTDRRQRLAAGPRLHGGPKFALVPRVLNGVEVQAELDGGLAGEVQRLQRNPLAAQVRRNHAGEPLERDAHLLDAALEGPDKAPRHRAGAHIQCSRELAELALGQVELLAADADPRVQPINRVG